MDRIAEDQNGHRLGKGTRTRPRQNAEEGPKEAGLRKGGGGAIGVEENRGDKKSFTGHKTRSERRGHLVARGAKVKTGGKGEKSVLGRGGPNERIGLVSGEVWKVLPDSTKI